MKLKKTLGLILLFLTFQSCYIADSIFLVTPEVEEPESLQTKCEHQVENYINARSTNEIYNSYGFSQLKIIIPVELVQLEALEEKALNDPSNKNLQDEYAEKKVVIEELGIKTTIELGHLFTLSSDSTGISILEIDYTLNDKLQVIDIHPKTLLTLPSDYARITDYFLQEHTIFNAPTYEEAKYLSLQLYNFFKDKMETYPTVTTKSAFLHHALDICKIVQSQRVFDQNYIAQTVFKTYLQKNRTDIKDYAAMEFSPLYETNKGDSLLGYYFFHKFMGSYREVLDTNVVLVEFSPYYQVDKIFQLPETFESYTTNTK
jgi:hypothetical protein